MQFKVFALRYEIKNTAILTTAFTYIIILFKYNLQNDPSFFFYFNLYRFYNHKILLHKCTSFKDETNHLSLHYMYHKITSTIGHIIFIETWLNAMSE